VCELRRKLTLRLSNPRDLWVTDGVRTRDTWSHKPALRESEGTRLRDSEHLDDNAIPTETSQNAMPPRNAAASEPSDTELTQGILDALAQGLGGVAKTLAEQLNERQRQRVAAELSKVIDLADARRKR
jgi:hypothetical protein